MFVQRFTTIIITGNIRAPHHWPFLMRIHWWPMDSPHKGSVIRYSIPLKHYLMGYCLDLFHRFSFLLFNSYRPPFLHYTDVIMSGMASQITGLTIVTQPFIQGTDQRKHKNSTSLAFVRGIHRWPVNSSHKGPVTRKMFPFDDVIM